MRFSAAAIIVMIAGRGWQAALKWASQPNRQPGVKQWRKPASRGRWMRWRGDRYLWGPDLYVVTARAFGVRLDDLAVITLSREHTHYRWVSYQRLPGCSGGIAITRRCGN
jgi:hypothetical protein